MESLPRDVLGRIAAGGRMTAADSKRYFGINGEADFGNPHKAAEMAATRAYAQALLNGDQGRAQSLSQQAQATHKDWTGGTLAKLAPAAAAFIPGIGPIAAGAIGAGIGGLESATGLDETPITGAALRGGALGGVGKLAFNSLVGGTGPGLSTVTAPAGRSLAGVGRFLTNPKNTPLVLGAAGQVANIYSGQQEGEVLDRQAALNEEFQRRRLTPRPRFADWQATRSAPGAAPLY
jgi:hypothetical protein